jgi:hypothetical protein
MRSRVVVEIERFIEEGDLWAGPRHAALVALLEEESRETGEDVPARLAACLRVLADTALPGPPARIRADVEAVVYPRLWKLLEAVRDDLPAGEQHTRVEALRQGLERVLGGESGG